MKHNFLAVIVITIFAVVMAFVIGSVATDGTRLAIGLVLVLVGIAAGFLIGSKIWWGYIFLAMNFPIELPGSLALLRTYEIAAVCITPFLIFHILKREIRWKYSSMPIALDISTFLFVAIMVGHFINKPAGMVQFGSEEIIDGRVYLDLALGLVFYFGMSFIVTSTDQLVKLAKYTMWYQLVFVALAFWPIALMGVSDSERLGEEVMGGRFAAFMGVGLVLVAYSVSLSSLTGMLFRPKFLFLLLFGLVGVALSGFRSNLLMALCSILGATLAFRRMADLFMMAGGVLLTLILVIHVLPMREMPYGVQRMFADIEEVEIDPSIRREALHSKHWRMKMWDYLLKDQSRIFIKDRIWGDGPGTYIEVYKATGVGRAHKTLQSEEIYALLGLYHSGPITTIYRIGYVGLVVLTLWMLMIGWFAAKVIWVYSRKYNAVAISFLLVPYVCHVVGWWGAFGHFPHSPYLLSITAYIKLFYLTAQRGGLIVPILSKKKYMPMMLDKMADKRPAAPVGLNT